ncbi:MAG: type II toxin-antitoxin system VapC family toxin [Candidatus Methylomirabilis oxyfera]|nr:type II toxin-antitoxin system VapC family toxin [Candidatus Methylomirabilis oxyfera]
MAVRFVLDSDVLIDLFSGQEPAGSVIPNLLEMDLAGTTAVTACELYSGASRARDRSRLDAFLATLMILPLDVQSARRAGAIDLSLRRQGQPINPGDNLIAGICLAYDLALVTRNLSHFRRVADLKVVTLEELSG